ncbi:GNAT family protein [Pantoea cypripedii]|uniref:GNAT family N-acetyltransferase n=1 Tax=Pantoea cypripedii TaxID=55209 RepID=UPI002FC5F58F
MNFRFLVIEKDEITNMHRDIFAKMLKYQGKVKGDINKKADRCKIICFAFSNENIAAIGALKRKTVSDFSPQKADLLSFEKEFEWELGYIYTLPKHQGKGLARNVVSALLESFGEGNLMASTEFYENPKMVHILESNDFKPYGKLWKSDIHENYLGLFLRFK